MPRFCYAFSLIEKKTKLALSENREPVISLSCDEVHGSTVVLFTHGENLQLSSAFDI